MAKLISRSRLFECASYFAILVALVSGRVLIGGATQAGSSKATVSAQGIPKFEFDPTWPKQPYTPLRPWTTEGAAPDKWLIGNVGGVAVDASDHVWIAQRPLTLLNGHEDDASYEVPESECCWPAPSVMEFDQAGFLLRAWGGPGSDYANWPKPANNKRASRPSIPSKVIGYDWPEREHAIFVDASNNVWVSNSSGSQIVKFNEDGKFLLQIGKVGQLKGSNDTSNLGGSAGIAVDAKANEVYVADGYINRRVIVFDATSGAYKRHWGAYGNKPDDSVSKEYNPDARSQQFRTPHCIKLGNDGLVYVCDRENDRIQVFRKDGTFVREGLVAPRTLKGTVMDIAFSPDPDQTWMYVADGRNEKVWIIRRESLEVVGSFGHAGHYAGGFTIAHTIATDSKGNVYVGESLEGKRVQRFLYRGLTGAN